tara:strand:- start:140 stop:442 length:303 start_codon:yes stop_codon:yes gene_type:complete
MSNYLVQPESLVSRAISNIEGFGSMVINNGITSGTIHSVALEVVEDWSNDMDEGHGFGSSDTTYMLKDFIDTIIDRFTNGSYVTIFDPSLKITFKNINLA